jgi:hypothetical protein
MRFPINITITNSLHLGGAAERIAPVIVRQKGSCRARALSLAIARSTKLVPPPAAARKGSSHGSAKNKVALQKRFNKRYEVEVPPAYRLDNPRQNRGSQASFTTKTTIVPRYPQPLRLYRMPRRMRFRVSCPSRTIYRRFPWRPCSPPIKFQLQCIYPDRIQICTL